MWGLDAEIDETGQTFVDLSRRRGEAHLGFIGGGAFDDADSQAGLELAEGLDIARIQWIEINGAGEYDILFVHLAGGKERIHARGGGAGVGPCASFGLLGFHFSTAEAFPPKVFGFSVGLQFAQIRSAAVDAGEAVSNQFGSKIEVANHDHGIVAVHLGTAQGIGEAGVNGEAVLEEVGGEAGGFLSGFDHVGGVGDAEIFGLLFQSLREGRFGLGGIGKIETEEVGFGFNIACLDMEAVAVVGLAGNHLAIGVFAPFFGGETLAGVGEWNQKGGKAQDLRNGRVHFHGRSVGEWRGGGEEKKESLTSRRRPLSMRGMNQAWKWWMLLGVVAVPWIAGLSHPFLYDDVGMIAENRFLEDPANVWQVLTGQTLANPSVVNGRRPAVLATYFLDRAWHGLKPAGFRATSLVLHLGCVALLMLLLWRLTQQRFLAAAAGVLFGLHPVLSEAVHAPGFRADVLCFFFILASLHLFMDTGTHAAAKRAGGILCLGLALLSKETAVVFPFVLGVLMVLFPGVFPAERRARFSMWMGCLGVAAGFFVLWALLPTDLQAAGGSWNGESLQFPETVFSIPALWTRTLRLLLVPWPLNVTPAFKPVNSPFSVSVVLGLGWMVFCGWGAWVARRSLPVLTLGLAWMGIFFVPVSNLWPLLHPVADRYFYPIVPGFAVLAAWVLSQQSRTGRGLGLAALAALYALLLGLRLGQWESAEKLWATAYFQNTKSATAATWLGLLREEAGDGEGACTFYKAAVEANPQAVSAWVNWGILEGKAGRWAESERLLRRAVEVQPEGKAGWENLAACLRGQGRAAEAAEAVARVRALQGEAP